MRPCTKRFIGFGILAVTYAMIIFDMAFYGVFLRVVEKPKSQLPRNWEISLSFWG
jgi:hypothetical protein